MACRFRAYRMPCHEHSFRRRGSWRDFMSGQLTVLEPFSPLQRLYLAYCICAAFIVAWVIRSALAEIEIEETTTRIHFEYEAFIHRVKILVAEIISETKDG